jgi:hypothetical protein
MFRIYKTRSKANGVPTNPTARTTTSKEKNDPEMNAPLAENRAKRTKRTLCLEIGMI